MRILLYEYTCANSHQLTSSLRAEGRAMFNAIREDLAGMETLLADVDEERHLRDLAEHAEFAIVIAPEFDGILAERCRWVEESGARLLSPSSAMVRRVSDKLETGRWLRSRGIPTPAVWAWEELCPLKEWVVKPQIGAGSQATRLVRSNDEHVEWHGELMRQEYVRGQAVSVVSLIGPRQRILLPVSTQRLSDDGRFHYLGGQVPWHDREAEVHALVNRVLDLLPELRGYVGMDMVIGDAGPVLIEINPRWTTSYLGLRALCEGNLVHLLTDLMMGTPSAPPRWREKVVSFSAGDA